MTEQSMTLPTTRLVKRHPWPVRLTHWINVIAVVLLVGTGLNIFNAHPYLYWGARGSSVDSANRWLAIGAMPDGKGGSRGVTMIGSIRIDTSGVLGLSTGINGQPSRIAYPAWATIPSWRDLGLARNWHFLGAWVLILNGIAYLGYGLASGHLRRRLLPGLAELSPRHIGHDIIEHLKLKFPRGEAATRYQVLQKIAYSGTALLLLPLMVFSGLGMAPGIDSSWPWIVDLFGGRQSARSIHWITTNLLLLFIIVHLLMLLLAGPFRLLRGMITGWQTIETEPRA